ncbi:MAG: ATP-binding cassette domain-containing protein [Chloroflexi bacterium]|nr:ATP-binding cassette domain-containing protein [Chloroflexota bacterium]MYK33693.1 ATP-binding cassette domain-containing protein [Chloroflexota bacterium]
MAILEVRNVNKSFGGNLVLEDVSMNAELGQVTSLIGPNGAGKSTLLNIVSGFLKADSGSVVMDGHEIIGSPPFKCFKAGIARTFQDSQVLYYMNGLNNVVVSSPGQRGELEYNALLRPRMVAAEERERSAEAMEHLTELNIQSKAASLAQALSYGQQKLLEFARMLNSRAQVFLLDEPMAGIHPDLIAGLSAMIRSAAVDHGKAVILVEHNLKVVMDVSDYVVVVRGEVVVEGPPSEVENDERLTSAFLGFVSNAAT